MRFLSALCLFLALTGCSKKEKPASEKTAEPATGLEIIPWSDEAKKLAAMIPDGLAGVAIIDLPKPVWDYVLDVGIVDMTKEERTALDTDLRGYMTEQNIPDFTGVSTIVGGASRDQVVIIASRFKGPLPPTWLAELEKEKLTAKIEDDRLIVASNELLPKLSKSKSAMAERLIALPGAGFAIVANLEGQPLPDEVKGLKQVEFAIRRSGVALAASGTKEMLDQLNSQIEMARSMALVGIDAAVHKAKEEGPAEGLGAKWASHQVKALLERIKTRREGEFLKMDVVLPNSGVAASVIGIAAAVAIPAFMKYTKKSKTSEARELLGVLQSSANRYVIENGKPPPPVGPTPPKGACCKSGEKCAPNPALWKEPGWEALMFSVDDPHFYSYEVRSDGTSFTVLAYGDLDCDGNYSTFSMGSEGFDLQTEAELE